MTFQSLTTFSFAKNLISDSDFSLPEIANIFNHHKNMILQKHVETNLEQCGVLIHSGTRFVLRICTGSSVTSSTAVSFCSRERRCDQIEQYDHEIMVSEFHSHSPLNHFLSFKFQCFSPPLTNLFVLKPFIKSICCTEWK